MYPSFPRTINLNVVPPTFTPPVSIVPSPGSPILPVSLPRSPIPSPTVSLPRSPIPSPTIPRPTISLPRVMVPSPTIPRPTIPSPPVSLPRVMVPSPTIAKTSGLIQFTPEMISEETIVDMANKLDQPNFMRLLEFLSDYYYNDQSLVEDKTFDQLQDIYEAKYGPYTVVAAEPRGEKVKLPYYMSSLRKLKKEAELQRWLTGYPGPYIVEDKIDGLTLLIVSRFDGIRRTTTLYTHGKAGYGKDVTHLLDYIRVPSWLKPTTPQTDNPLTRDIAIRGEIVMNKSDFLRVGAGFKNARNLVSGIINSKQSFNTALARELSYYAYRIVNNNETPEQQIHYLQTLGFNVPSPVQAAALSLDILSNYYEQRKKDAPYEADGLVIYQNRAEIYPEGESPRHVVAFKTETESAVTTVIRVEWEGSKDLRLKPTVIYEPVQLSGATLQRASGYNGRYIVANNIGPGAKILITRSGDVIPDIVSILTPAPGGPAWPDPTIYGVYEWDSNQVELVLQEANSQVIVNKLNHFITTLDIKHFGPARVKQLVDHGVKSIGDLLAILPEQMMVIPGIGSIIANQFYNDLHNKISNVPIPEIMAASGFFSKIGVKRFEAILEAYPNFLELARTVPEQIPQYIENIEGFGTELSRIISEELPRFLEWLNNHPMIRVQSTTKPRLTLAIGLVPSVVPQSGLVPQAASPTLAGMNIVFSGFRDKNLEDQIKVRGGKISTSVSSRTSMVVMKDVTDLKGKANEALERKIPLISKDDFIRRYLS